MVSSSPRSPSRAGLAELLRTRRDRLTPADVGLPAGSRRRTAGLRREEVAQLAGVSATYYTFLEQGRDVRPSRQVVAALAGALRLSPAERAHLFQLAGIPLAAGDQDLVETVDPVVGSLVSRLDPFPAYVKGGRWDVLAANRAARALFTDWAALAPGDRNKVWWMFTDPAARKVYVEWEQEASDLLGRFRAAAARRPDDPAFTALIERLHQASPEVRDWWPRYEVRPVGSGTKRLHHPALGDAAFQHTVLQVADHPEQMLVYFTTSEVPEDKLAALAASVPGAAP
ncbi:MAG TPA: helix-turn-helix transcriptional regulator [Streptosporangiaceae bacterium]|nr:helix-turn-helix transcriptional regulator [Streptosporangiaceae bacterium]